MAEVEVEDLKKGQFIKGKKKVTERGEVVEDFEELLTIL